MSKFNIGIGSRVFHAHRQDNDLNYVQHGTVVDVENGCNGGIVVQWDYLKDINFKSFMVASDLAVIHDGRYTRLALVDGLIYPLLSM